MTIRRLRRSPRLVASAALALNRVCDPIVGFWGCSSAEPLVRLAMNYWTLLNWRGENRRSQKHTNAAARRRLARESKARWDGIPF